VVPPTRIYNVAVVAEVVDVVEVVVVEDEDVESSFLHDVYTSPMEAIHAVTTRNCLFIIILFIG
jgi:hypothetical protein